jgi:hypothetical protein
MRVVNSSTSHLPNAYMKVKHSSDGKATSELDMFIRVMPDYSSNGIWHRDGTHAEPDELPVSPELLKRLARWADWYNVNDDYLPEAERKNRLDWPAFEREGVAVAYAIKQELPDWTVLWFDERKLATLIRVGHVDIPRSAFEFEVLLDGSLSRVSQDR